MSYVITRFSNGRYFTGEGIRNGREGLGTWSPHRKFAKIYVKRAWAQKAAHKWDANVLEVEGTQSRFA